MDFGIPEFQPLISHVHPLKFLSSFLLALFFLAQFGQSLSCLPSTPLLVDGGCGNVSDHLQGTGLHGMCGSGEAARDSHPCHWNRTLAGVEQRRQSVRGSTQRRAEPAERQDRRVGTGLGTRGLAWRRDQQWEAQAECCCRCRLSPLPGGDTWTSALPPCHHCAGVDPAEPRGEGQPRGCRGWAGLGTELYGKGPCPAPSVGRHRWEQL